MITIITYIVFLTCVVVCAIMTHGKFITAKKDIKMMAKKKQPEHDMAVHIDDYTHMGSSIGNAFFSGLTIEELWNCVLESKNSEELDFAVSATIWLKELCIYGK